MTSLSIFRFNDVLNTVLPNDSEVKNHHTLISIGACLFYQSQSKMDDLIGLLASEHG